MKGDDDFDRILRELNFDESSKMIGLPAIRDRSNNKDDVGGGRKNEISCKDTPVPLKRVVSQLSPQELHQVYSPSADLDIAEPQMRGLVMRPNVKEEIKIEQNPIQNSDEKLAKLEVLVKEL